MATPKAKKIEDINVVIDLDALTLDDLELVSILSEGTEEDRAGVPGYKIIQFLKRVAGDVVGQLGQEEIEPLMTQIAEAIKETQNPKGPQGKN